jgi:UDP-N-acetylglucosamine acyltransferase
MARIHPTAILDPRVELADDVEIGPYSVLEGRIKIGAGTRVRSHVFMQGPLVIGEGNDIWPFAVIGTAPQTSHFNPDDEGPGTVIGNGNAFREHCSVHRSIHETEPTRIGNDNLFMDASHIGHDSQVHNNIVFAQASALGGHVIVEDRVIVGGGAMVHQFCRIGRGALLGGVLGLTRDLMPWFTTSAYNVAATINVIGMKRSGHTHDEVDTARWVFRLICRSNLTIAQARREMETRRDNPLVEEYLVFMDNSTRSLCTSQGRLTRTFRTHPTVTA